MLVVKRKPVQTLLTLIQTCVSNPMSFMICHAVFNIKFFHAMVIITHNFFFSVSLSLFSPSPSWPPPPASPWPSQPQSQAEVGAEDVRAPEAGGCRPRAGGLEGFPLESSWRRFGISKTSSGELLEAPWRLPEPSWRLLESLGGVLGALGTVLETSWVVLGRAWRRIRGVLEAPWVVLEPS